MLALNCDLMWPILIKIDSQCKNLIKSDQARKALNCGMQWKFAPKLVLMDWMRQLEFQNDRRLETACERGKWGERTYLAAGVKVGEELASDFHEDDLLFDAVGEELAVLSQLVDLLARFNAEQGLTLDGLGIRGPGGHGHPISTGLGDPQEVEACLEVPHHRPAQVPNAIGQTQPCVTALDLRRRP